MTEKIAKKLSTAPIRHGIVRKGDYTLYVYSYQTMLERLIGWGFLYLLSFILGRLPPTFVFTAFYGFLRMFTGGWHASSFGACFAVSLGIYAVFSLVAGQVVKLIPMWVLLSVIAACGLAVLWLGPIAHPNKPMERKQLQMLHRFLLGGGY